MTKKKQNVNRILIIVSYTIPTFAGGGRNAFNFAKYLRSKKIPVTILTFNRNFKQVSREKIDSIPFIRIPYLNRNLILKILSSFWIVCYYAVYILKNKLIYIIGDNIIAYQFIILFASISSKSVIFRSTMYGDDDLDSITTKRKLTKPFYQFLFRQLTVYHSIHPGFTNSSKNILKGKVKIIETPQGVDINHFSPLSENEKRKLKYNMRLPDNKLIILSIGILIKRKGYLEIFEALSKLTFPFVYIVIGEYNITMDHYFKPYQMEMKELYSKGKELLNDNVIFTGPCEEVVKYLQIADLFLINSFKEGLPNSLLEAASCGLPLLSRGIYGLDNNVLYQGKNAIIYKDTNEIIDILTELNQNRNRFLAMGKRSREIAIDKFSFSILIERFSSYFF